MSERLWLVTAGEYSDYHVVAAFETADDARSAVARGVGDGFTAVYLYGHEQAPVRRRVFVARATIGPDGGRVQESRCWEQYDRWIPEGALERPEVDVEREGGRTFVTVDALDRDSALKACRDREAKIRAEVLTEP